MDVQSTPTVGLAGEAGAVIVAAGQSRRMGGVDKIWAKLAGRPLIAWTVAACERAAELREIVLVVAPERLAEAVALGAAEGWQRTRVVATAGPRRRDAVRAGLEALEPACRVVVIHDGARPLVTPELIAAGLATARARGAATAGEPVKETLKRVRDGVIIETLPREQLVRLQTPQVFAREWLSAACAAYDPAADPPDEATLAYALGLPLAIYPGSHDNLKVTTPDDLPVVEALLARTERHGT